MSEKTEFGVASNQSWTWRDRWRYRLFPPSYADYLKDGETAAECLARNRADLVSVLGLLAKSKTECEQWEVKWRRTLDVGIANTLREADRAEQAEANLARVTRERDEAQQALRSLLAEMVRVERLRLFDVFHVSPGAVRRANEWLAGIPAPPPKEPRS